MGSKLCFINHYPELVWSYVEVGYTGNCFILMPVLFSNQVFNFLRKITVQKFSINRNLEHTLENTCISKRA